MTKSKSLKYMIIAILSLLIIYYHNKLILMDNKAYELLDSDIRLNYNIFHPLAVLIITISYSIYNNISTRYNKITYLIYICLTLIIIIGAWTKGWSYFVLTLLILGIYATTLNGKIKDYINLDKE
ncbi:hypothetical protein KQI88_05655 [Alkaliphilus sp. MSJ-5]|uniref:Uncharacterized protein n=1 Tax=Alkaliphilus flagellatus TaxID=2841507 RepID=A0ABS6G076_9FIRM|nr:hypothetical protein [Alkaliphilus flagellatus]MBU5675893.1 hypothetical protein [Alkaliphilus flagellatus]